VTWSSHIFWHVLFSQPIVSGAGVTILLATLSQAAGIVLGLFSALGRLSRITLGRRFMFAAVVTGFLAWVSHRFLAGELNAWWRHHIGANPPGGAETWLTYGLALVALAWLVLGFAGLLWKSAPRWLRWIAIADWYPLKTITGFYIWLFRGTPLLVQLFFVYFALPGLSGGHLILNEFDSAFVALSLNEGAYMAEIVRAGITSVEGGQMEAALSVGMTRPKAMTRIIIPQAIRVIIPPTGNEYISMLKNTALAYAISVGEMFYQEEQIRSATFQSFPDLSAVCVWYLAMTTLLTVLQGYVERYFEKGFSRNTSQPGAMQRLMAGALRRA